MNRYPIWKYVLIAVILIVGLVYTLPNFYGESPAVQVSPGKATAKVTENTLKTVEDALKAAQISPNGVFFEQGAQQNSIPKKLLTKLLTPIQKIQHTLLLLTLFQTLRSGS